MSPADVKRIFFDAGFKLRDGACVVETLRGRTQRIQVDDPEDGLIRLQTTVASRGRASEAEFGITDCWVRNRLSELIGLRIASRGEVIAETWVPLVGLDAESVRMYVHHLAVVGDRFEHQISGKDEF